MANSDERPDILSLRPRLHGDLPGTRRGTPWARLRVAYVSAVAALFELIDPRHELYFVARDGEPFYDVARLATRNDPERARRLHLLNVSRLNMDDAHLADYLAQEGLSAGGDALLVDIGFCGTIADKILSTVPRKARERIHLQMMLSLREGVPSSRTFLVRIHPRGASAHPEWLYRLVEASEYLPHYTARSDGFIRSKRDGRWHPVQSTQSYDHKPAKALRYMQDLAAYVASPPGKRVWSETRGLTARLLASAWRGDLESLKQELRGRRRLVEAVARDVIATLHDRHRVAISPADVGLASGLRPITHRWIYSPGTRLGTDRGLSLTIARWIGQEPDANVYRVRDEAGRAYTLSVVHDEREAAHQLRQRLGDAPDVVELGRCYVLQRSINRAANPLH